MDRDQSAPTEIHEGVDPASVAATLHRRNQLVARRQRALQGLSWAISLLVVGALASGAWWLSGEMTSTDSGRLSFLLGSDVLPADPDTAPAARTASGTITFESAEGLVTLQVTHDSVTGNGRILGEVPALGIDEAVLVDGQSFERPAGQTGWTVRPTTAVPLLTDLVAAMQVATIGTFVPDEARPFTQILGNRREMSGATVVRHYDLSIDQDGWSAAMPASYNRWVSNMGIDAVPRPGGYRISLWIDEGGVVLRWRATTADGETTTEVSIDEFDTSTYLPPTPPAAWPIG